MFARYACLFEQVDVVVDISVWHFLHVRSY